MSVKKMPDYQGGIFIAEGSENGSEELELTEDRFALYIDSECTIAAICPFSRNTCTYRCPLLGFNAITNGMYCTGSLSAPKGLRRLFRKVDHE